jgi:thiol oxidase
MSGKHTDPKYIGPGIWVLMHIKAINAIDFTTKIDFLHFIDYLCNYFPCDVCRMHIIQYVESNPPLNYFTIPDGLFYWSWMFHNAVNQRLGKSTVDYNTAKQWYSSSGICHDNCGADNGTVTFPYYQKRYYRGKIRR